jgi:hypothetical protein
VKKNILAMVAILSLSISGVALAESNPSNDISEGLKDIKVRLEVLEAKNKELEEANKAIEAKTKLQESKDGNSLRISGVASLQFQYTQNPRPLLDNILHGSSYYGNSLYYYGNAKDKVEYSPVFWLFLDKKIDENSYAHALIGAQSLSGTDDTSIQFMEGYYASKTGNAGWAVGRFMPYVGKGLLYYAAYSDGVRLTLGSADTVKADLYSFKKSGKTTANQSAYDWVVADTAVKLDQNTNMSLSYVNDGDQNRYRSKAIGLEYKGLPNINITTEYGVNSASYAKTGDGLTTYGNGGDSAKGMFIKAKYKGANPFIVGTTGFWVTYKKADDGFDSYGYTSPLDSGSGPHNWSSPSPGGSINDIKGFEYGFEATIAPRAMLQVRYGDMEAMKLTTLVNQKNQKYVLGQVTWLF